MAERRSLVMTDGPSVRRRSTRPGDADAQPMSLRGNHMLTSFDAARTDQDRAEERLFWETNAVDGRVERLVGSCPVNDESVADTVDRADQRALRGARQLAA